MATILIAQNSVTKLWICRYRGINPIVFFLLWILNMSRHLFLHPISTAVLHGAPRHDVLRRFLKQTYSRDNTHRATYYDKIQYLVCTFQKPNCELAAVCKQSCTHCVLSPAISLHVPPHREIKHFLHKDSSGNMVDFVFSSGEVALYSVRSVTWTLVCCPLSFMFLLYEM